ncbi:unnamed protein product [Lampetra fluviatilis]
MSVSALLLLLVSVVLATLLGTSSRLSCDTSTHCGDAVPPACSTFPCPASCDQTAAPCNGLVLEELWEKFDLDTWQHENTLAGGGTWEFQQYTNSRRNSYVRNGTLFIRPTLTEEVYGEEFVRTGTLSVWGLHPPDECTGVAFFGCERSGLPGVTVVNPVQSASVRTTRSFTFTYGRLEASGCSPKTNAYGSWPLSGHIKVAESRGNVDLKDSGGVSHGVDEMDSVLHWGPSADLNAWWRTYVAKKAKEGTFGSDFHKYEVERTPDYIRFLLDGEETLKVAPGAGGFWALGEFPNHVDNPWKGASKMAPFDQEFYLELNLAVGGASNFLDEWTNKPHPKPWKNSATTAMLDFYNAKAEWFPTWKRGVNDGEEAALQVRAVRVWAYK